MPRIILAVTNDLYSDQRLNRMAVALTELGFGVEIVGRKLPESPDVNPKTYRATRMKLIFRKSFLFYAEYNLRLFLFLLFRKADILVANDLDTMPACYFAAKLKGIKWVFDSHELFTEVPELIGRPLVKRIWQYIEDKLVPRASACITVCESIASQLSQRHGVPFHVVRNVSFFRNSTSVKSTQNGDKLIVYQGALNVGRGIELLIDAMEFLPEFRLKIIGSGDIESGLKDYVSTLSWRNKIEFTGRIPFTGLFEITTQACVGLSIEENMGLNYYYALPNKLFDYIQARIPVIVSPFPEMERIVTAFGIGKILPDRNAKVLSEMIFDLSRNKENYLAPLEKAANELCWENEVKVLEIVYLNL
jgi:glycosyltransferase involved in cell wall biosynthesis